ncbi:hypothetical protein [Vibrio rhodolitus]|uniref:hypothetical protein n=1 Tax=Vibrio rhodolitus TaxID=2231649 RepID=UPI000F4E5190|nr:hypothetical protein [Vibrio rhodolitus]
MINVVLKDPDGRKRQEEQDFVDNLPANTATTVAGACTVLMAGTCAVVAGIGEITVELVDYITGDLSDKAAGVMNSHRLDRHLLVRQND